jgi:chorismate mutase/prephenate dehydratase
MARKVRGKTPPPSVLAEQLRPLREGIDGLDNQIVDLLNRRAGLAQRIGQIKNIAQQPAYVPERERQVLNRLMKRSRGPLSEDSLRLIYKEIISASLALESPLQVAFVGPQASLAHEAAKRHFGLSARLAAQPAVGDVFAEVLGERCAYGVVPVENTAEGLEHATLDVFIPSDVGVCAEVIVRRNYHLLTGSGTLTRVRRILAHPADLVACRNWLEHNLPDVMTVSVPSTAQAAAMAQDDASAAVLVQSDVAASLYKLHSAASNLKDSGGEMSRFWVIGHDEPPPTGKDRTSVLFAVKDVQGILYKGLQAFARAKINMTRIESRPARQRQWDYLFFVDLDGHKQDPPVKRALQQLADSCAFMKILGSYPRGRLDSRLDSRKSPRRGQGREL